MISLLQSRKGIISLLALAIMLYYSFYVTGGLNQNIADVLKAAVISYGVGNVLAADYDKGDYLSSKFLITLLVIALAVAMDVLGVLNQFAVGVLMTVHAGYAIGRGAVKSTVFNRG